MTDMTARPVIPVTRARVTPISRPDVISVIEAGMDELIIGNTNLISANLDNQRRAIFIGSAGECPDTKMKATPIDFADTSPTHIWRSNKNASIAGVIAFDPMTDNHRKWFSRVACHIPGSQL